MSTADLADRIGLVNRDPHRGRRDDADARGMASTIDGTSSTR